MKDGEPEEIRLTALVGDIKEVAPDRIEMIARGLDTPATAHEARWIAKEYLKLLRKKS